jgi:hypothetical protein
MMLDLDFIAELFEEAQSKGREYLGDGYLLRGHPFVGRCSACGLPPMIHARYGCRPPIPGPFVVIARLAKPIKAAATRLPRCAQCGLTSSYHLKFGCRPPQPFSFAPRPSNGLQKWERARRRRRQCGKSRPPSTPNPAAMTASKTDR